MDAGSFVREDGLRFRVNKDGKTLTLDKLEVNKEHVIIPENVMDMEVISIGFKAFSFGFRFQWGSWGDKLDHSKLKHITIPKTVRYISNSAFSDCGNLNYIFIPKTIKVMKNPNFARRTVVCCESFDLPNRWELDEQTLEQCIFNTSKLILNNFQFDYVITNDQKVIILKNKDFNNEIFEIPKHIENLKVIELYDYAFSYAKFINPNILINNDIERIGEFCFKKSNLESILLPTSLKFVGKEAIDNHVNIFYTGANIPKTWDKGFSSSQNLYLQISGMTSSIDKDFLFAEHNTNLILVKYLGNEHKVLIPDGVTKILGGAISGDSISHISFSNMSNCKTLGDYFISDCPNLKSINFPLKVDYFGKIKIYHELKVDRLPFMKDAALNAFDDIQIDFDITSIVKMITQSKIDTLVDESYDNSDYDSWIGDTDSGSELIQVLSLDSDVELKLHVREWDHGHMRKDGEWSGSEGESYIFTISKRNKLMYQLEREKIYSISQVIKIPEIIKNIYIVVNLIE